MSKKNTVSERQKRFIENKKDAGFKKIQVYISEDTYKKLSMIRDNNINEKITFSNIIDDSIIKEFFAWSKKTIRKKNEY